MKAEHINPFIQASQNVIKSLCNVDIKFGKVSLRQDNHNYNHVMVFINLIGRLRGQVNFEMHTDTAKKIASTMMGGISVEFLDEISKSAISEMGNMIMGNACSIFSNSDIQLDITPPVFFMSENMAITNKESTIVIPMDITSIGTININVCVIDTM